MHGRKDKRVAWSNATGKKTQVHGSICLYDRSLTAFEQAREEIERYMGTTCAEYATVLNNMAGTYQLAG